MGLPLRCIYLRCCGGGRQSVLSVETFLEITAAQGWVDEVDSQSILSGGFDRPLH